MRWLVIALAAGCATHDGAPSTTPPDGCPAVTLVGSTGTAIPTRLGPWTLDATGVEICAHLDASQITYGHFSADTASAPGAMSAFQGTLTDPSGTLLATGADVTIGVADPTSFMNVEYTIPGGSSADVIVHVAAKSAPATTAISLSLYDPLD